jgi:hypothetical protein
VRTCAVSRARVWSPGGSGVAIESARAAVDMVWGAGGHPLSPCSVPA